MDSIIKNYIHSTNFCSFKKFVFIQQNNIIHSRKIYSFKNSGFLDPRVHLYSTNQVPRHCRQTHSTNLPVLTPVDLKSLRIIHRHHSCQNGGQGTAVLELFRVVHQLFQTSIFIGLNKQQLLLFLGLGVFREEEQNSIFKPFDVESIIKPNGICGKICRVHLAICQQGQR